MEELKRKSSCVSMICVCLTNSPQITLMVRHNTTQRRENWSKVFLYVTKTKITISLFFSPQPSGVLPCPPDLVVTAVLLLLKLCSGTSSSTGCSEVNRNIIGSGRVQKSALEALTALSSCPGKSKSTSKPLLLCQLKQLQNLTCQ